jgi:adenylate cyclase
MVARTEQPAAERALWPLALLLPLALVVLLRGSSGIDERWENRPAHFWLVLATALVCLTLAVAISEGGRRRRDARLLLIGLAFVVSAGFLGLHALATPGVIVEGKNAGFVLATPIGLVAAGGFAALSAIEYRLETSLAIVRHARLLLVAVLVVLAAWAAVSVAGLPPLHHAVTPQQVETPLGVVAAIGVVLYGIAAWSYFRVYDRRGSTLAFAVAFAFALLAEALIVVVVSLKTSWQLSWWEWHALMLLGFVSIATAASREWYEERFSALYLDETLCGEKEVSVLFADLAGFTPFTEARGSEEVHAMLVTYFGRLAPLIRDEFGGEVHEFVGDEIFAVFNKAGDQPNHPVRAARAALALQRVAAEIAADHQGWPPFRVARRSSASSETAAIGSTASSATPSTSARGSRARRPPAAS